MFIFNGLKEELGRHRGTNAGQYKLYGDGYESTVHVLWKCPVYRKTFIGELRNVFGEGGGGGVLMKYYTS